ncbi:MAG: hypothetical protein Q8R70_07300 [Methanoregula sp.]|nr:hypothetical protein [Methanoregula sp.]
MPNFDGNGPLKRGRVIGRGQGSCRQGTDDCTRKEEDQKTPVRNESTKG